MEISTAKQQRYLSRLWLWHNNPPLHFGKQISLPPAQQVQGSVLESPESWQKIGAYNPAEHSFPHVQMPWTATSKLFPPLACTFLITKNWVPCLFCISPCRESKLQDVRYGRMILRLLRKAKELISLSLHLLPCSWWLFLPGKRLLRPCWENDSSGLLVSDGFIILRS